MSSHNLNEIRDKILLTTEQYLYFRGKKNIQIRTKLYEFRQQCNENWNKILLKTEQNFSNKTILEAKLLKTEQNFYFRNKNFKVCTFVLKFRT